MLQSLDCHDLQDDQLLAAMKTLAEKDREDLVVFLVHLIEVDKRKLYAVGHSSLFKYLTDELKYSESCAGKRTQVARLAHRWPFVLADIGRGSLNLSGLCRLAPYLKEHGADAEALLVEARGKSIKEIEKILATRYPRPDTKDFMRRLPSPVMQAPLLSQASVPAATADQPQLVQATAPAATAVLGLKKGVSELKPLSATRVEIRFTGSGRLREKIEKAKALLSHKYPKGELEHIMEDAIDALLTKIDPGQKPLRAAPKKKNPAKHSRYAPKAVRREVWLRDGYQCAHVSPEGVRCTERRFLQRDHITPFALGGSSRDPKEQRLLCWGHNQKYARDVFGKAFMEKKILGHVAYGLGCRFSRFLQGL